MAANKVIALFIDNPKEEITLQNFFRSPNCHIKIARNMADFRTLTQSYLLDLLIIDGSVSKGSDEISKIIELQKINYIYLTDHDSDKSFPNKLLRPYSAHQFINLVEESLRTNMSLEVPEVVSLVKKYKAIIIDEIITAKNCPYDYYVKINDSKFVKVAKEGQKVVTEMLSNLKKKDVNTVYVLKEDYKNYLNKITNASLNINRMEIAEDVKLNFLAKTTEVIMDQVYNEGVSKELFLGSKQILDTSMELIMQDKEIFSLLNSLNSMDENSFRHALAVSIYSIIIAKALGWETEGSIYKLSIGALFSDIGLKCFNKDLVSSSRLWLSQKELVDFQKHPLLSAKMLRDSSEVINEDILAIIEQHHENCDGSGFPRGLTKQKIHPMARVVRLAGEFCELALKGENNSDPESPKAIITRLYRTGGKKFDYTYLVALGSVYGLNLEQVA